MSEYGWTTEEIFRKTPSEIAWILKAIDNRRAKALGKQENKIDTKTQEKGYDLAKKQMENRLKKK